MLIAFFSFLGYWAFFDMGMLPTGELISQLKSPNSTYTVKMYISDGRATTLYVIRGELNFNNSRRKPKNIYWSYRQEKAKIEWIGDDTVIINEHELDVLNGKFDFRRNL